MVLTCRRSVIFSGCSGFLHQWNWRPGYNWNIVESGVKHHRPNRHNKAFLVPDSCRATVINGNNISADFTRHNWKLLYVCFSYFGTSFWISKHFIYTQLNQADINIKSSWPHNEVVWEFHIVMAGGFILHVIVAGAFKQHDHPSPSGL